MSDERDIVERLRDECQGDPGDYRWEAADEITCLRHQLEGERIEGWVLRDGDYNETGPFFGHPDYIAGASVATRRAILTFPEPDPLVRAT